MLGRAYRRYWVIPFCVLLCAPLAFTFLPPVQLGQSEARRPAPAPDLGLLTRNIPRFFRQSTAWMRDHFGFRAPMVRAHSYFTAVLMKNGNAAVLVGSGMWLYLRSDQMIEQSAGLLVREDRVRETAATLARIQAELSARGIGFLVASPPNTSSIVVEPLPGWARNNGRVTELDLLTRELRERGITTVDLRPLLRDAHIRGERIYRQYDTHWTSRGALLAFNAIMKATERQNFQIDAASSLGAAVVSQSHDLARMLGVDGYLVEATEPLVLSPERREVLMPNPTRVMTATLGRPGATILIIGDSFTESDVVRLAVERSGRVAWIHHNFCRFDWDWVNRLLPAEVWWMPTERHIVCPEGASPIGMAREAVSQ